jgi:hypothetical protein
MTAEQTEVVGWLLDYVRDYADCYDDVEPGELLKYEQAVSEKLEELEGLGLGMFAGKYRSRQVYENGKSMVWPITVVSVVALDDPKIEVEQDGTQHMKGAVPKGTGDVCGEPVPAPVAKKEEQKSSSKEQTEEWTSVIRKAVAEGVREAGKQAEPIKESEAQRVFGVLRKLRIETGVRKAPLHTVFEYMVMQGLSGEETARKCKCVPSLISARVKTLQERFGMSVDQLRNYASPLSEMEATVKGDRRRRKSEGRPDDFEGSGSNEDNGEESDMGVDDFGNENEEDDV